MRTQSKTNKRTEPQTQTHALSYTMKRNETYTANNLSHSFSRLVGGNIIFANVSFKLNLENIIEAEYYHCKKGYFVRPYQEPFTDMIVKDSLAYNQFNM